MSERSAASTPASAAIMGLAQQRANELVLEAKDSAEQIRAEARTIGYQDGYSEGYAVAEARVHQRYEQMLLEVQQSALKQEEEVARWFEAAGPHFTGVVLDALARLVKKQVDDDRDLAGRLVGEALDALSQTLWMKIRVHPRDLEGVERAVAGHARTRVLDEVSVVADESIHPGGLIVDAPGTRIDASLETRMGLISSSLEKLS
jgi:flagellar assembly protein FliH